MHKRITFRHMNHSDPMEDHVNKQLGKIERFLEHEPTPISIDIILEASKVREHPRAELRLKTPHHDLITHYEHNGVDLYAAIDHVIDQMYELLRKAKDKEIEKKRHRGRHEDFKKQR